MSEAWLQLKDMGKAGVEADAFLHSALETADPHLQALAWEVHARIAISKEDWTRSKDCIHKALKIVQVFEVPIAAWQVHAIAVAPEAKRKVRACAVSRPRPLALSLCTTRMLNW